jgi:hypothetical protein
MADDNGSDSGGRGKWDNISKMLGDSGAASASSKARAAEALQKHQAVDVPHSSVQKPDGAIAQFKASQIGRKTALKHVQLWYEGQLEAARHAVAEAVRVRKAEASRVAERLLMEIDSEHVEYLLTLGLRNSEARSRVMIELGDQTSRALKEIEGRDWPPPLIQQAIDGVWEKHRRFFQKIMEELGDK